MKKEKKYKIIDDSFEPRHKRRVVSKRRKRMDELREFIARHRTHQWANLFVANILRFLVMRVYFSSFFFFITILAMDLNKNTQNRNFCSVYYSSYVHSIVRSLSSFFFFIFFFWVLTLNMCAVSQILRRFNMQSIVIALQREEEKKHRFVCLFSVSVLLQIFYANGLRSQTIGVWFQVNKSYERVRKICTHMQLA